MTTLTRMLTAGASLLLVGLFVLPLWSIDLIAPQYPEGLGMVIRLTTVTGRNTHDLDNINELNHYIGMKPIVAEAIPELRFMPWIVGGLVALGLLAAALGRRKALWTWVASLGLFGVLGLVDFWRWSYDYGHNLDSEHAIIKVPGMTYQPPLIGTKQLLNFTATSWPAIGGWLAAAALLLGVVALVVGGGRLTAPEPRLRRGRHAVAPRAATVEG